jgi:hypothetical protein
MMDKSREKNENKLDKDLRFARLKKKVDINPDASSGRHIAG